MLTLQIKIYKKKIKTKLDIQYKYSVVSEAIIQLFIKPMFDVESVIFTLLSLLQSDFVSHKIRPYIKLTIRLRASQRIKNP